MPQRIFKVIAAALTFAVFALIQACEKPDDIGKNILPPSDNLNVDFTDTITIHAYSFSEDSVKTSGQQLLLAGSYLDPVFGQADASFYSQVKMPVSNLSFGSNPVVDSVVLSLTYFSFYGDTTYPQTFEVYEVLEDLDDDTTYFSSDEKVVSPQILGSRTFTPHPQKPLTIGDDTLPPGLRIPIDNALAERFFAAGTGPFTDNEAFTDFFKGIKVKAATNTSDGAILYFDPLVVHSALHIYYHNDDDTITTSFYMNEDAARFSHFDHDFSTGTSMLASELQQQVVQKDTAPPVESLFLQSMAGVNVKIQFPHIANWRDEDIAVNKATLVVETDTTDYSADRYKAPLRLGMAKLNEDGKLGLIEDFLISPELFDGRYRKDQNEYHFNITRHIQEILSGEPDYGMIMLVDKRNSNGYRAALMGPQAQERRMRLELIYTKLDND